MFVVLGLVLLPRLTTAGSLSLSYRHEPQIDIVYEEETLTRETSSGDEITLQFEHNLDHGYTISVESAPLGKQGGLQQESFGKSITLSAEGGTATSSATSFDFSSQKGSLSLKFNSEPPEPTVVHILMAPK